MMGAKLENVCLNLKHQESIEINLPVKTICGVACKSFIRITNYNVINIVYKITNRRFLILDNENDCNTPIELYSNMLCYNKKPNEIKGNDIYEKICEISSNLKLSKKTGKFITHEEDYRLDMDEYALLYDNENCEQNTCCVCLDICSDIGLRCRHIVCIDCYEKLNLTLNEDGEERCFCPLCRKEIAF
jgi:hypothetical protein